MQGDQGHSRHSTTNARFLGIDQSLTHSGISLINDNGALLRLHTIIPRKLRGVKRLVYVREALRPFLVPAPVLVAMEGYSYNSTIGGHQLGEVGGAIKILLEELDIPFISVAPLALKKFATGNSAATKEMMIAAAIAAGVTPMDDHQADAYFLSRISRMYWTGDSSSVRAQLEVIQSLKIVKKRVVRKVRRVVPLAL